jgi:hypothetical protein
LFVVQARRSQGEAILEVGAIRNAPLSWDSEPEFWL